MRYILDLMAVIRAQGRGQGRSGGEGDVPSLAWAMATRAARITALDIILVGLVGSRGQEI